MVNENTFRPPYFHRNCMSEFMGLISGAYDAKKEGERHTYKGFLPGGGSLHSIMTPHGPDAAVFEAATTATLKPVKLPSDGLAFMFETNLFLSVTKKAAEMTELQRGYYECWQGLKKWFDPGDRNAGPK